MSREIICGREEALSEINTRRWLKGTRYAVFIRPFLPISGSEGRGFEGCALVPVTRKAFIKAVEDSLRNLEERGAQIVLTVPTEDYEAYII